jgi:hypothetical protein
VEKETFLHYFQGTATAYGILIGRTQHLAFDTERNFPLPNLYVSMLL